MTEETRAAILKGRATATTLISAPTGRGKTSLLATVARHLWKSHRKLSRLYISDGGGGIVSLQAMAQRGVVQTFRLRSRVSIGAGSRDLAFETCHRATQGWWPKRVDPVTGICQPSEEMVPPVTQILRMYCPKNHLIAEEQVEARLTSRPCPECLKASPPAPGTPPVKFGKKDPGVRVTSSSQVTPGFENVGVAMFDGITSMNDWVMTDLADRSARKELGGEDAAIGGIVKSGAIDVTGNNRAHYQLAQSVAERWLVTSGAIPGLTIPAIWTALEVPGRTEDGEGREWGPAIAGSAKTGKVPAWVGNYLGCQLVEGQGGREEFRLYLRAWVGPDGLRHPYRRRTDPRDMPEYLSDWNHDEIREYLPDWEFDGPPGTPFSGFNLAIFYALLERSVERMTLAAADDLEGAPGVPQGGVVEVGGGAKYEADDQVRFERRESEAEAPAPGPQKPPALPKPGQVVKPGAPAPKPAQKPPQKPAPAPAEVVQAEVEVVERELHPTPQPLPGMMADSLPGGMVAEKVVARPGAPPVKLPPPKGPARAFAPPPGDPPKKKPS